MKYAHEMRAFLISCACAGEMGFVGMNPIIPWSLAHDGGWPPTRRWDRAMADSDMRGIIVVLQKVIYRLAGGEDSSIFRGISGFLGRRKRLL